MPKVTMEFNLPEERDDFMLANAGRDFYLACLKFDKYLDKELNNDKVAQKKLLKKIRDEFNEIVCEETDLNNWEDFVQ